MMASIKEFMLFCLGKDDDVTKLEKWVKILTGLVISLALIDLFLFSILGCIDIFRVGL